MSTYQTMPQDAGQVIAREWTSTEAGAICRTTNRSTGRVTYTLHRWTGQCRYEPQNGVIDCAQRGRRITEAEARRIIDAD